MTVFNTFSSIFLSEENSHIGEEGDNLIDQLVAVYDCYSQIEPQRTSNLSQNSEARVECLISEFFIRGESEIHNARYRTLINDIVLA